MDLAISLGYSRRCMIYSVSVSTAPLAPGQARNIAVNSDGEVAITIYCVRSQPPPMQLFPCGKIVLQPGVSGRLIADPQHFPYGSQGELRLNLMDMSDGDERTVSIPVGDFPEGLGGAAVPTEGSSGGIMA